MIAKGIIKFTLANDRCVSYRWRLYGDLLIWQKSKKPPTGKVHPYKFNDNIKYTIDIESDEILGNEHSREEILAYFRKFMYNKKLETLLNEM